jgi:AraC-like DNA-binding protein
MIASALQHRILSLANQVGARNDHAGAPALLHRHVALGIESHCDRAADRPALTLVLEGRMSVWRGEHCEIFRPGGLLLLPAHLPLDVTYEPCSESGTFRAVLLEFAPALVELFCNAYPETPERLPGEASLRVDVDPPLAESLAHALEALLAPEMHGNVLAEHRLMGVLLRLRRQGRLPDLAGVRAGSPAERVRDLIRLNPAEEWTAELLAPLLGLDADALATELAMDGGLARILEEERMNRALRLFARGNVSLSDVAYACGYESPDRFAKLYRAHHGAAAAMAS